MGCMSSKDAEGEPLYRQGPAMVAMPPALDVRGRSGRMNAEQAIEALMEQQKVEMMASMQRNGSSSTQTDERRWEVLWADDDDDSFITVEDEEVAQGGEAAVESKEVEVEHNEPAEAPMLETPMVYKSHGASLRSPITPRSSDVDEAQLKSPFLDDALESSERKYSEPTEASELSTPTIHRIHDASLRSPITSRSSDVDEAQLKSPFLEDALECSERKYSEPTEASELSTPTIHRIHGASLRSPITPRSSDVDDAELKSPFLEDAMECGEVRHNEPAEVLELGTPIIHRIHGASLLSPITSRSSDPDEPQPKHLDDAMVCSSDDREDCGTPPSHTSAEPHPQSKSRKAVDGEQKSTISRDLEKRVKRMKKKSEKVDKKYRKEDYSVERQPFQSEPVRSKWKTEVLKTHQQVYSQVAAANPSAAPALVLVGSAQNDNPI